MNPKSTPTTDFSGDQLRHAKGIRNILTGGLAPLINRTDTEGLGSQATAQFLHEAVVRGVIFDSAAKSLESPNLQMFDAPEINTWKGDLEFCLNILDQKVGMQLRLRVALIGAIEAAFALGVAAGETEQAPIIVEKLRKDRTRAATEARRNDTVREIIKSVAEAHWRKHPTRRGKFSATAREIVNKVKIELGPVLN